MHIYNRVCKIQLICTKLSSSKPESIKSTTTSLLLALVFSGKKKVWGFSYSINDHVLQKSAELVICKLKVLKKLKVLRNSRFYLPWKHETRCVLNITQMQSLGFFVHNGQLSFWIHHVCPPSTLSARGKKAEMINLYNALMHCMPLLNSSIYVL